MYYCTIIVKKVQTYYVENNDYFRNGKDLSKLIRNIQVHSVHLSTLVINHSTVTICSRVEK
jgi:hypothetical protein